MFFLIVFYSILFLAAFRYLKVLQINELPKWYMPSAFALKMLIGVIYLSMYLHPDKHNAIPSDTMNYLNESKILNSVFYQSKADYFQLLSGIGDDTQLIKKYLSKTYLWDSGSINIVNDSRNIIRLNSLIQFISFGIPFIHTLFMCLISLIGLKHLFITFQSYTKLTPFVFFSTFLLLPSLLFWTSGILKEPILFLGLSLIARATLIKDPLPKRLLYSTIGLIILLSVKPYVIACLIISIFFFILYKYIFKERLLISIITYLLIGVTCIAVFTDGREKVINHLARKQFDFDNVGRGGFYIGGDTCLLYFSPEAYLKLEIAPNKKFAKIVEPVNCQIVSRKHNHPVIDTTIYPDGKDRKILYNLGGALSYVKTTPIKNSLLQLIKNIPEALINGYFRPFPTDPGSGLKYPAMVETWLISFFLIYIIFNQRKIDSQTRGIIFSLLIFAISIILIIGWTIPIIGAIFRYRLPTQIALLLVGVILINPVKLNQRKSDN